METPELCIVPGMFKQPRRFGIARRLERKHDLRGMT
jgi:hypothetical protein